MPGLDALKVLGRGINSRLIALGREGRAGGERERARPAKGERDADRVCRGKGRWGDGGQHLGCQVGGAGEGERSVREMGGGVWKSEG